MQVNLSRSFGQEAKLLHLEDVSSRNIPLGSIVVTTIELEDPVLASMTEPQLQAVKIMADNASVLLWITGGGLYKAERPEFALILGLARSLMLERPSQKIAVLDLDNHMIDATTSSEHVVSVLHEAMYSSKPDFEYRQHDGVLYNSRFVPDLSLNKRFRQAQDAEAVTLPVSEAGNCQLALKRVGQTNTLHFKQVRDDTELQPGYLEVQVKAVGINAKVSL